VVTRFGRPASGSRESQDDRRAGRGSLGTGAGQRLSGDFGRGRDFDESDGKRSRGIHLGEYVQQVVDADQVSVFVVAHYPLGRVVDPDVRRKYERLCEVDKPYVGVFAVVHEQQRAADHLRTRTTL